VIGRRFGPGHLSLLHPPTGRRGPRLAGGQVGDAVQPAAQRLAHRDRSRLAGEHEKGGLEGVLRVLLVAQDAAADTQHHRAVSAQQRLERRRIPCVAKAREQLPVG
jgi:hypothetical protein